MKLGHRILTSKSQTQCSVVCQFRKTGLTNVLVSVDSCSQWRPWHANIKSASLPLNRGVNIPCVVARYQRRKFCQKTKINKTWLRRRHSGNLCRGDFVMKFTVEKSRCNVPAGDYIDCDRNVNWFESAANWRNQFSRPRLQKHSNLFTIRRLSHN